METLGLDGTLFKLTPAGKIVRLVEMTMITPILAPWRDRRRRGRIRHARMSKGKHTQRAGKLRR